VTAGYLVLIESNTTGSGRLFAAAARDLGLRPVLFSRDPDRYSYVRADRIEVRRLDTTDPAAIQRAGADLDAPVAGVTSSSEYSIAIAAEVARELGLPHPDPDAVRACRDKLTQRERLRDAGISVPRFAGARTAAEAVEAARWVGWPVVVKPVAGSGSIGVRLCSDADAVAEAAGAVLDADLTALALPPQDAVVVEEYLPGPEFSVEMLDRTVVGSTRKHLGAPPFFVETGHDFPAPLATGPRRAIEGVARAALSALGLGWGAAHVELRSTPTGPRIVEVNPRLAGGMIPRVVQLATGIDMIGYVVAEAAGMAEIPRPDRAAAASIRFLVAEASGYLAAIDGLAEASGVPRVVDVGLLREPGQRVELRHSFQDRLAYVIATGDPAEAPAAAATGLRALTARIDAVPATAGERAG
jgi:S-sulfo-L-cysteine synthase (3-phospho-L-serine-dependent)